MALAVAALVLVGCGGGGSHTYVMIPSATGGSGVVAAGIYVTFVSPVALPQGLVDQMKKTATLVEQPVGPEICSYSKRIQGVRGKYAYLNGTTLTVKVNGSNPFISFVCAELKKRPFDLARVTAKPRQKAHTTSAIGPIAFTAKDLKAESRYINTKFYWAGPQQGVGYEFTRNNKGYLFVRYLPKGVPVGAQGARFLVIATYPFPGAYAALKKQAKSRGVPGPNGSVILQRPHYRKSVLMAFPGVDKEIEIYDPNPAIAIATAESGDVKPVR